MLRDTKSIDLKKVLQFFVSVLLLCVVASMIWFTARGSLVSTTVQNFEGSKIYYASTSVEEEYSEKAEKDKERLIQPTNTGNNRVKNVLRRRAVELQAGCKLNQTQIAMSRQDQWKVYIGALFVNDRYKFLFCEVPKVASTNILRILLTLDGKVSMEKAERLQQVHETAEFYMRHLSTYSKEGIDFRLNNYKKVIFVREPLERLVSAYRNRFEDSNSNVTFPAFVQYLQDLIVKKDAYFDVHWKRTFDLCFPCHVSYDIIGKYETIDQDMRLFLNEVGANDVQLQNRSTNYQQAKSSDVIVNYYKQLTMAQLNSLRNFYYVDAVLYGYKFPTSFGQF